MNLGTFGPEHPTRPAPTQQAAGPRAATCAAIEAMPHPLPRLTIAGSDSLRPATHRCFPHILVLHWNTWRQP